MNITYTGKQGVISDSQQRKLDTKFAKLSKLVERNGAEKGAHVVITTERHLTNAEITLNFHDHGIVGIGSGPDYFAAVGVALDKAEKQAQKVLAKFRDTKKGTKEQRVAALEIPQPAPPPVKGKAGKRAAAVAPPVEEDAGVRINRINHHEKKKPMTLEEAMIAIGTRDYMVYRDADKNCVSVLMRRKDGSFDLVES